LTCPFDSDCGHFNDGKGIEKHCSPCGKKEKDLAGLIPKKRKLLVSQISNGTQREIVRRAAKRLPIKQGLYLNASLDGYTSKEIAELYSVKDPSNIRKTIRRALKNIKKLLGYNF
jgi:DNA-directed RNA polymerase specialized sigma24 family protein